MMITCYIVAFCTASYGSINLECHLLLPTKTLNNEKILGYFHYKIKEYIYEILKKTTHDQLLVLFNYVSL